MFVYLASISIVQMEQVIAAVCVHRFCCVEVDSTGYV